MPDDVTQAVSDVKARADALLVARVLADGDDWAELTRRAVEVVDAADEAVRTVVLQARAGGVTWKVIGDALGVTRQAAFQRYGRPTDPTTGEAMDQTPLADADRLAASVIDDLAAGRWSHVTDRFDAVMRDRLPEEALAAAWTQVIGLSGALEAQGEPEIARAGDVTVANVALAMEAGDYVARLSFRDDRTIAGLHILAGEQAS